MKKLINIVVALTMLLSLIAPFRVQTASAASVTKQADYLPYGWTIFTANGATGAGTNPVVHSKTEAKYVYYTMGDIIQGNGGTPGGQVALVGYGPDNTFGTADDVVVSVAPVASDTYGTFAIATSSVPQDGAYAIRDYTNNQLGSVLVSNIYIMYRFSVDQKSLTYNCSAQTISGWVFRGDGTGAAYNSSIKPAGDQTTPYTTYVHVIYPSGKDVYTSVLANGQFALSVNVDEKGVYRIYVEDNYGDPANPGGGSTEFGFIYAELPTGKLSITLSTYVDPTYLYDTTTFQQEVVLRAVDQDGDPVSGATFSILSGFANYSVFEIAPGFYKVVGIKSSSAGIANFQVQSTVGGANLKSNVVSIPFKALSDFNPVVSVDVYNVGETTPPHQYSVTEYTYDTLPCTVGYSLVIKPGVFDVKSGYMIYDVSATVDGPVSEIEDTTPVDMLPSWSNSTTPLSAASNVVTTVGDPKFHTWNTPSNQVSGTGIVYDGFYSGKDNYLVAPRYLVTGPGTISVTINQTTWKQVDGTINLDKYNACCDPQTATFKICDISGCDVTPEPTSITVGTPTDIKVNVTSKGLNCGCNMIVHIVPTWTTYGDFFTLANGQKVPDLWYNISGTSFPNMPVGISSFGLSSYGASVDLAGGTVTFKGVTANYCDYLKVEVFTSVTTTCPNGTFWKFAFVDPYAIYVGVPTQKLSYSIVGQTGSDNQYLVAGVPDTVVISGFVPNASLYYLRMDLAGDGSLYYNTDTTYTAQDNGDGTYTIQLTPPPSVFGTAYPNKIKIALRVNDYDTHHCKTVGYVEIPVKAPTYETTLTVGCGKTIPNDNIITEGFIEKLTLTKLVDPRTGKNLTPSALKVSALTSSSECYLPTAWVDYAPCEGCSTTAINIIAVDNPNVNADPKIRPYITLNGVNVRLSSAVMKVVPATVTLSPNKDIPYPGPADGTLLTLTAIDAHGVGLCGRASGIGEYAGCCGIWTSRFPNTDENGKTSLKFKPSAAAWFFATFANDIDTSDWVVFSSTIPVYMQKHVDIVKYGGISIKFGTTYVEPPKDTTPPTLTVTAPADKSTVDTPTVRVAGSAKDDVGVTVVSVNDVPVTLLPDGSFATTVTLAEGDNTIVVKAFDAAGNVATQTLTVTYKKPAPTGTKIVLRIGSDVMTVNGKVVQLDAAPEINNGRTFLPLRAIAEAFGAQVTWVPETQGITVVLGNNQIGLQIGNNTAVVNGNVLSIVPPYIKNGRTMVPIRVIAEGFGAQVEWDPVNYIVTITMP